jgi:hypothetical protein
MYRVVAVKKDRIQTIAEKVKIVCYSQNANFGGFHRNLLADFWRILADSIAIFWRIFGEFWRIPSQSCHSLCSTGLAMFH